MIPFPKVRKAHYLEIKRKPCYLQMMPWPTIENVIWEIANFFHPLTTHNLSWYIRRLSFNEALLFPRTLKTSENFEIKMIWIIWFIFSFSFKYLKQIAKSFKFHLSNRYIWTRNHVAINMIYLYPLCNKIRYILNQNCSQII